MKGRDDMHPEDFQGPASYALTREEYIEVDNGRVQVFNPLKRDME
jgi:hypothetical protein